MAKTVFIFLALFVFVAHCYVLNDKGLEPNKPGSKREKRWCHVCEENYGPPGHPPPPPYFRTRNWSGLARNVDGSQQGVFSGASADLGSQNSGQAFSLASSSSDAGSGGQASGINSGQSAGYGSQSTAAKAQAKSGGGQGLVGQNTFGGHQNFGESDRYKESQYSYHSGGSSNFGGEGGSAGGRVLGEQQKIQGSYGGSAGGQGFEHQRQVQGSHGGFGSGQGFESQQQRNLGGFGGSQSGSAGSAQTYSSGLGSSGNLQSAYGGYGHGHGNQESAKYEEGQQVQNDGGAWQGAANSHSASSSGVGSGAVGGTGYGSSGGRASSGQEALSGALSLASQGLQTAQGTGSSDCSTCGKNSYALSNAKSRSGNAVALSVGG